VPKTKTPKRWTVLAWIAGDNNLDSYGLNDIKEMKRIGSTKDVDVVVQFDRRGNGKTYRYHLKKGTPLASDVVDTLGETDTGDPAVATDFFTWGIRTYPSEKVLAVIWNHGSGIDEADVYARARNSGIRIERRARARPNIRPRSQARAIVTSGFGRSLFGTTLDSAIRLRAIAYDDYNRDFLDNAELKRVLVNVVKQAKRPIDVLGFDACLMNMVEVAYQLRGLVGHIVASEAVEPGDGWPYEKVIGDLAAKPSADGATVARSIVKRYLASYPSSEEVTDSAVDVSRVQVLAQAVDNLAAACIPTLQAPSEADAFGRSVRTAQRFDMKDYVDLGALCNQLILRSPRPAVQQAAQQVLTNLQGPQPFVIAEGHKGKTVAGATGTAIYFPLVGDVTVNYGKLDFAKSTRWGQLITAYGQ